MIETHFSSNASYSLSRRGLDRSFILPVQLPFPHSLANSLQSVTQEDAVVVVVGKSHFYRFRGGWLRCAREPTKNKNSNPGPCLQCQWNKQLCTHREIYRQTDADDDGWLRLLILTIPIVLVTSLLHNHRYSKLSQFRT